MKDVTLSMYFVQSVIKHAAAYGFDTDRLLRRANISPRLINEDQARVSAAQFVRLQVLTMRDMNDEFLGYSAYPLKTGQWAALCHWLISCKTLGQALKRYCLFYDIVEGGLKPILRIEQKQVRLEFLPRPADVGKLDPYAYELYMYNAHRLLCWLTESVAPVELITFDYSEPAHASEYRPTFLGLPIRFESETSSFVFTRKLLSKPITQNHDSLANLLRNPVYFMLVNPYQIHSWSQRIKDILGYDLSKLPSFLEVAQDLDVNPKRLRRLLKEEGLTYSELKTQIRRDIAIYHLSQQETSVEDIAFKTGFSESSAFIRAFKKWTGVTPYTYRKDLV